MDSHQHRQGAGGKAAVPIARTLGIIYDIQILIACVLLCVVVVSIFADVVLRSAVGEGVFWAGEFSEYSLLAITLLAAPWLLRRGGHIKIDFLVNAVSGRMAAVLGVLTNALGFAICLILVWYSCLAIASSFRAASFVRKLLVFPEWWLYVPVAASFFVLAIEFSFRLAAALGSIRGARR